MKSTIGILCGGKSRRMGHDKAFLPWKGETMLDRAVRELSSGGRDVLISASEELALLLKDRGFTGIVLDEYFDHGPLEGIRCLMKQAKTEFIFFCAVDMPFLDWKAVEYLEEKMKESEYADCDCMVFGDAERTHPLCGIYRTRAMKTLEEQLTQQNYRVMAFFQRLNGKEIQIQESGLDFRILWNANTPEDYERALKEVESL